MKRLTYLLSMLLSSLLVASPLLAGDDPYEDMAVKLSAKAGKKLSEKKIAILTFDYIDGRSSTGGRVVSEKLTNRFVELGDMTVIERGMVEKVMKELEFQNTGSVDPEKAKKLGKGLGVEAIVTGTLQDESYGNVEINARVIKTETYEIIAAATIKVKKTWSDAPPPQPAAAAPAEEEAPAQKASYRSPSSGPQNVHGYLDFLAGASNAKMNATFSYATMGRVTMSNLTTNSAGVVGLRVGGFGEILGGDFEMSGFNHGTLLQPPTIRGYLIPVNLPQNFLQVGTFEMSGDLMLRFPTGERVIPYFGLGMGLSINTITSSVLPMYGGRLLSQTEPGFLFRVPVGVRFRPVDPLTLFVEGRFWMNTFSFNRGYAGETDTITETGSQFLAGIGLSF